jgi:phospholipid N-methyltransferase
MTKEEVLKECTIEGNVVKLPEGQLDRKVYLEVKKSLELINGKWKGGKVMGFVFQEDPTELLAQVANGEKRNLKKEYQFFATPDELATELVDLANIEFGDSVLEPSAGQGAIIKAIRKQFPNIRICAVELMDINRTFLKKFENIELFDEKDFMNHPEHCTYDIIIANPPFTKNQDIDHVMKMYSMLNDGGRLVSITSEHWEGSTRKKESEFEEFLHVNGAEIINIEKGAFKESGTMVGGKIVVIDK